MLRIVLQSSKPIVVPKQYNYGIHQFLFENLSPSMIRKYYDSGFTTGKRTYKLFTFSVIDAPFRILEKHFKFAKSISIYFNSYEKDILENFANNLLIKEEMQFLGNHVQIESVEFGDFDSISDGQYITRTLSPIVVRRTYKDEAGKKKSKFYSPSDDAFLPIVRNNLYRKLKSVQSPICNEISMEDINSDVFDIELVECDERPKTILYQPNDPSKHFVLIGYTGTMILSGRKEFIEMAIKSGIGERNSSGFGMLSFQEI